MGAESGALDGVVFVEFEIYGHGGVGGFPAPFADGDELKRDAFFPTQAGTFAADEEAVTDADVVDIEVAIDEVLTELIVTLER